MGVLGDPSVQLDYERLRAKKAFTKEFTKDLLKFLSNFCPKIYLRIFVKKRMRSHGMPMFFHIGSFASLATKTLILKKTRQLKYLSREFPSAIRVKRYSFN